VHYLGSKAGKTTLLIKYTSAGFKNPALNILPEQKRPIKNTLDKLSQYIWQAEKC
jgi:hypothetical protein